MQVPTATNRFDAKKMHHFSIKEVFGLILASYDQSQMYKIVRICTTFLQHRIEIYDIIDWKNARNMREWMGILRNWIFCQKITKKMPFWVDKYDFLLVKTENTSIFSYKFSNYYQYCVPPYLWRCACIEIKTIATEITIHMILSENK